MLLLCIFIKNLNVYN